MVYLRCDVCFCLNAFKVYVYVLCSVFCWFIFYENELNLVIMCPLETGFGELDGSYIITLLGNPAIAVEKSLEMGVYVK